MKMNFKKTLSLVLAVLMVMTAVPLSGMATTDEWDCETQDHKYIYTKRDDGKHLIECEECDFTKKETCDGPAATSCNEKGKCLKCGNEFGDPLPHSFKKEEIRDDNLASKGDCKTKKTYYKICEVCDALPENREGAATFQGGYGDHSFTTYNHLGNATCTNPGDKKAFCDVCKTATHIQAAEESEMLPHEFVIDSERRYVKIAPTCETEGEYFKICINCSAKGTETFKTEKLEHTYIEKVDPGFKVQGKEYEPTCSKGQEYYMQCETCFTSAKFLDPTKTFNDGVSHARPTTPAEVRVPTAEEESSNLMKKANCINDARYYLLCKKCGERVIKMDDEVETEGFHYYEKPGTALNLDHNKFSDATLMKKVSTGKDGDCTTAAVPDKYECCADNPDCKGKTFEDYSPYNANLKVKEVNGIKEYERDENGNKISLPFGHKITKEVEYKAPKCAVEGNYASKYCSGCNISFYFDVDNTAKGTGVGDTLKTIKATGHKNTDGNDSCDICGAILKPSDTCDCICHKTSGIMYFVALILKFFWKLSGSNEYCKCTKGDFVVTHY